MDADDTDTDVEQTTRNTAGFPRYGTDETRSVYTRAAPKLYNEGSVTGTSTTTISIARQYHLRWASSEYPYASSRRLLAPPPRMQPLLLVLSTRPCLSARTRTPHLQTNPNSPPSARAHHSGCPHRKEGEYLAGVECFVLGRRIIFASFSSPSIRRLPPAYTMRQGQHQGTSEEPFLDVPPCVPTTSDGGAREQAREKREGYAARARPLTGGDREGEKWEKDCDRDRDPERKTAQVYVYLRIFLLHPTPPSLYPSISRHVALIMLRPESSSPAPPRFSAPRAPPTHAVTRNAQCARPPGPAPPCCWSPSTTSSLKYTRRESTDFGETHGGSGVWFVVIHSGRISLGGLDALMHRTQDFSFSDSAIVALLVSANRIRPLNVRHGLQITSSLDSTAFSSTAPPPSRRAHPPRLHGPLQRLQSNVVYGAAVYSLALALDPGLAIGAEAYDAHAIDRGLHGRYRFSLYSSTRNQAPWRSREMGGERGGHHVDAVLLGEYVCYHITGIVLQVCTPRPQERRALLAYASKQAVAYPSNGAAA
ncbi:hypothetical protein B0H16DRAFT_1730698 [Mycena metata]|uniref:Uncharacterized protein n=1 Tax=Mycena metata TaxID=1033252 RepID=A0AAD7I8W3_9AGAR|nr:hypothetical protein B0H16DRAFT_1730698 [Mycena metata]